MRVRAGSRTAAVVAGVAVALAGIAGIAAVQAGHDGDGGASVTAPAPPSLTAEVKQNRRDEIKRGLQVSLTNAGPGAVTVEAVQLQTPALGRTAPSDRETDLSPGQRVNVATTYGEVHCGKAGEASAGPVTVLMRARVGAADWAPVRLALPERSELLDRIVGTECRLQRLDSQVSVRVGDDWATGGAHGAVVLQADLELELRDTSRVIEVTQVAGSIMYDVRPVDRDARPLARLDEGSRNADVALSFSLARCDPHTRAEIKKPYEFVMWLTVDGGEEQALVFSPDAEGQKLLRKVCAF